MNPSQFAKNRLSDLWGGNFDSKDVSGRGSVNLGMCPVSRETNLTAKMLQKNKDHFSMPTSPPNGVEHVCFMRFALLGGI